LPGNHLRRSSHVVRPVAPRCWGNGRAESEGARREIGLDVVQAHGRIGPRAGKEQHIAVERYRQDEAVVVVSVLADEVDPAGGAEDMDSTGAVDAGAGHQCGGVAGLLHLRRLAVDALNGTGKGHWLRERIGDGNVEWADFLDDDVDDEFV